MKSRTTLLLFLLVSVLSTQAQTNDSRVDAPLAETAEDVVNRQLDAYNSRDIDLFVATYSEDIEIYNWKGEMTMKGHDQLREGYESFFANTPNLHCRIVNRILINNKVIDKENVTANDRIIKAVAIYEVTDGKISKVTFVN